MIGKLAFRNLFRNRWRSLLTAGGVAAAVMALVWMNAFLDGFLTQMIKGATSLEVGQVQFQTKAYADDPNIRHAFPADADLYQRVEAVEGVAEVEPRAVVSGLLGTDRRSRPSRFVGVEAGRSEELADALVEGRWLSETQPSGDGARGTVVGIGLARQFGIEVGDDLLARASGRDGSAAEASVTVVGIVEAGHSDVDQRTAFLHLADAQGLAAIDRQIHELMIRTTRIRDVDATIARLEPVAARWEEERMGGQRSGDLIVRPWQAIVPTLANYLELSGRSMWFMYLVLYFLAALGILNTQRMSTLDREREFGVMQAIGMTPGRLFATVLWETTLLTLIGAVVGAGLGTGLNLYLAEYGLNLGAFLEEESFAFMGVAVSMRVPFSVTFWGMVTPILAILPVALLCGLWPALSAARLEPARAIAKKD